MATEGLPLPVRRRPRGWTTIPTLLLLAGSPAVLASPFIEPGNDSLRADLTLLHDRGMLTRVPLVWPLSWNDVAAGLTVTQDADLAVAATLTRVRAHLQAAEQDGLFLRTRLSATTQAPLIRTFLADPREDFEATFGLSWTSDRFAAEVNLTRVAGSGREEFRLDGSQLSMALGNWALTMGSPERWWGPGWQSSLIFSTNARPMPQIGVRRIGAVPPKSRWLSWLGAWSLETFVGALDDDRFITDGRLFGMRFTANPVRGLTVGLSRSAQFCGEGRVCDLETFGRLLLGKDNRGNNVSEEAEPGNQLAGVDFRYALKRRPIAVYWQWVGEDSRRGGPLIGDWLRQFGFDHHHTSATSGWHIRSFLEISETTCRHGGMGTGRADYNCGYEHGVFRSGYRYEGRSIGHSTDSDSLAMTTGLVLNQAGSQAWSLLLQVADINDSPPSIRDPLHSVSAAPAKFSQLALSHRRDIAVGEIILRLRHERLRNRITDSVTSDANIGIEWRLGY